MVSFLKSLDPVLAPDSLLCSAVHYILDENRDFIDPNTETGQKPYLEGNGESVIQNLLDQSNHKLRMYGTAAELAENLKIFQNFPGSHSYINSNICKLYSTTPIMYQSLKNEKFFCKSDLFVILQNMLLQIIPGIKPQVNTSMMSLFLKSQEVLVSGHMEFVRFDQDVFDEIEKELRADMKNYISSQKQIDAIPINFSGLDFNQVYNKFLELLPLSFRGDHNPLEWTIHRMMHYIFNMSSGDGREAMALLYFNSKVIIDSLRKVIEKRSGMFRLNSEVKDQKGPITVRLFEDGNQKFVISTELIRAMDGKVSDYEKMEYEMYVSTVKFDEVQKKHQNKLTNIEFIRTPILRSKHRAVPIKGVNPGEFYILASDAFFHQIRSITIGCKMFQRPLNTNSQHLMNRLSMFFMSGIEEILLFELKQFSSIEEMIHNGLREEVTTPLKDIRNAKSTGFTVDNLRNELRNLGITDVLEEILDHVDEVYAYVDRVKKHEVLRTCDLFDAIELCQLIAVINRIPKLKTFLHNQNACGKVVTIKCELCKPIQPSTEKPSTVTNRFKGTELKVYPQSDVKTCFGVEYLFELMPMMLLKNGPKLYSSLNIYRKMIDLANDQFEKPKITNAQFDELTRNAKMFILDEKDLDVIWPNITRLHEQLDIWKYCDAEMPFLHDLKNFSKIRRKTFYIRHVTITPIESEETLRVFAEEILEILPIILKDQGYSTPIEKYQQKWKTGFGRATIGLEELTRVLEEMDIDKNRILLVPDMSSTLSLMSVMRSGGNPVKTMRYEKSEDILDISEAIFTIFQSIICDIDWSKDPCEKHPRCMEQYKSLVMLELQKLISLPEGLFISMDELKNLVKLLKTSCNYKIRKDHLATPLVKLFDLEFSDSITASFFLSESTHFQLYYDHPTADSELIPVWKARILFMVEWANRFFVDVTGQYDDLNIVVKKAMMHRVAYPCFESESDILDLILQSSPDIEAYIQQLLTVSPESSGPVEKHEWMKNVTDRSYVIRGQSHKWNDPKSLKVLREIVEDKQEKRKRGLETIEQLKAICSMFRYHGPEMVREEEAKVAKKSMENDNLVGNQKPKISKTEKAEIQRKSEIPAPAKDLKPNDEKSRSIEAPPPVKAPPISIPKESENSQKVDNLAETLKLMMTISEKKEVSEKSEIPPLIEDSKANDVKSEAPPPAQAPPIPVPKESKNCQKCYRTCEMLNETKKELTRNEQKMKKLEKKLGEIKGENTKEIEKKDREMEEFNRKIQKSIKENEELKGKIEGLEVEKLQLEEKLARQEEATHDSQLKLTEQISILEISLKNESEKSLQLQNDLQISRQNAQIPGSWTHEKQYLEQQIGAQNQKIQEFHTENIRLKTENELNSRMVQQLMDKLAQRGGAPYFDGHAHFGYPDQQYYTQSYSNPGQSTSTNYEEPFEPAPIYYPPPELQYPEPPTTTISNSLLNELQEQWTSSSTSAEVAPTGPKVALAAPKSSEPKVAPTTVTTSSEVDRSTLPEVAPAPLTTSSEVPPPRGNPSNAPEARVTPTNTWQRVENRSSRNSRGKPPPATTAATYQPKSSELEDSECLICLVDVKKKHRTIKCHHCRRRFHKDCASKWVKVKSECPACRGRFLDPDEFPTLS